MLRTAGPKVVLQMAAMALVAFPAFGQARPVIEIVEPAAWSSDATRGIGVRRTRGLRVVGTASSNAGIDRVTLNGAETALSGTGDQVRFIGYATPTAEKPEVVVEVYVGDQVIESRTFPVVIEEADATFDDPATAWGTESGFTGERWAVVIGVSEYADRTVPALRYADDDARAFRDFLLSPAAGMGGFKSENIRFLVNEQATYRDIRLAFRDFLKAATDEDVVFIFFAGHGAPDPERPEDLYLLAYDTEAKSIAGTGFPMEEVSDAVRRTYARTIISFIDACHSAGVSGDVGLRAIDNPINRAFLDRSQHSLGVQLSFTASQVNQYSQEGAQWGGGHGVFTYFLMRGLQGEADEDGDGIVTLGESLEWTRDRVRRETRNGQIPTISQTAFDPSWPMSIGGGPEFAVLESAEPAGPSTDRSNPPLNRPSGPPPSRPAAAAPAPAAAGDGMLVLVFGEDTGASLAEESVLRSLRARRDLRVMDATSLGIASGDHAAVQSAVQGDFASLAELVRAQGGEFVFLGNLEATTRPAAGSMYSASAQLELRMYRVSTGEVVESGVFRVGMAGQPAKIGGSELGARSQASEEVGRLGAVAARGWIARALR
ncbi:MAG: caspase family protein [Gemmatimonadetes bacterium]|nr:caspase family protein [Gemmatimonadota bacterium]MDA1103388.1 caspase family protein [Gemmatimonadota bacterium]